MISVNIIIVNWNAGSQLVETVSSLACYCHKHVVSVIIVDNASTDNSLMCVEALVNLPFSLCIIRNVENLGFAVACNQGAKHANSDYLLFLNPDTALFKNSLSVPFSFMQDEANSEVGICGIQLIDDKGIVARTCAHFPSLLRFTIQAIGLNKLPRLRGASVHMAEWDHLSDKQVDHVIGAFFLMRRVVFDALVGFDERFFVYLEDVDFSLRARHAGWKTVYLASVQAFHFGGGTSQQIKATRLFYSLRSRLLYGLKHFSTRQVWVLFGVTLFVEPFSRTLFSLLCGGKKDVFNTWRGYIMLYHDLPDILRALTVSPEA